MATVTVTVPEEIKKEMDKQEDVNWSAVARKAFQEKLSKVALLEKMDKLLEKSTLTEKDAVELGRKVNKSMWENHYKHLVK